MLMLRAQHWKQVRMSCIVHTHLQVSIYLPLLSIMERDSTTNYVYGRQRGLGSALQVCR